MDTVIVIEDIIKEINIILTKKYKDFRGSYFFGSRKKGSHNIDSDYDIVFVFDRKIDWVFKKEIIKIIYDIELKYDIFIDAKIYNTTEISEPTTPFRHSVLTEGIFYAG